jgi:hypothetical protein
MVMTKVNFAAAREKAEDAGLLKTGGIYNKTLKNGDNRFRLVSECLEHPGSYNGKPTFKWLCLVLDRAEGRVLHAKHGLRANQALQMNLDYRFDQVPMPYDRTLNIKSVKTKDVDYKIVPARQNTALSRSLPRLPTQGPPKTYSAEFQLAAAERENGSLSEPMISADSEAPTRASIPASLRNSDQRCVMGLTDWVGKLLQLLVSNL